MPCWYSSTLCALSQRDAPVNFSRSQKAAIARYWYQAVNSELICTLIAFRTSACISRFLLVPFPAPAAASDPGTARDELDGKPAPLCLQPQRPADRSSHTLSARSVTHRALIGPHPRFRSPARVQNAPLSLRMTVSSIEARS